MVVHFLEGAGEDDVMAVRLGGEDDLVGLDGEVGDHFGGGDRHDIGVDLLDRLRTGVADDGGHRQVGHAEAHRGCGGLAEKAFTRQ